PDFSSFLQSYQPYGFKDIHLFVNQYLPTDFLCLLFYATPSGVQILDFSSFLQSCQPYGFKDIHLFVNQYLPTDTSI
ncbi:MAG: hypothetical protein Q8904_16510, partial [Bacteroidota bacterium]|nr:hypothetical protein [Bacteroidota bacterium]